MKKLKIAILFIIATLIFNIASAQNIGINSTGNLPNASALLDIDASPSNNKGLLIPRLTTSQRSVVVTPANGLMIYNITTECLEIYNATINQWASIGCTGCQLPGLFSAIPANNITAVAFDANWTVSAGATTYYLDVATDASFTTFVSGYNNLNVGNVLTKNVTGLIPCITYYYRVRANNSCGTGSNSNIQIVSITTYLSGSLVFNYTGVTQTFTVPACVDTITVKSWASGGGGGGIDNAPNGGSGGGGAYVFARVPVTPNENLTIIIGGGGNAGVSATTNTGGGNGGYGGGNGGKGGNAGASGGSGAGGGGGGGSAVLRSTTYLLVAGAGAGGGGAGNSINQPLDAGGVGGGGGQNGGSSSGSGGTVGASGTTNGTQGANRGAGDGGGSGGGGGGYNGGTGGGGATCDCGGGGGGGGNSYINTGFGVTGAITNGTGQISGNVGDTDLCSGCAQGGNSTTNGTNGMIKIIW